MKKYILLISVFTLLSCSSEKIENKIVSDFFDKSMKKENRTNSFIIEESVSKLKAIEIYKIAFSDRNMEKNSRRIISSNNYNEWPIDSLEIDKLIDGLNKKKDTIVLKWKLENFNNKEFNIIKNNLINDGIKKGKFPLNINAIKLSKPLLDKRGKSALIFYSSFGYFIGGETQDKVFLLQKINGNWEIMTYYYNPKIMN